MKFLSLIVAVSLGWSEPPIGQTVAFLPSQPAVDSVLREISQPQQFRLLMHRFEWTLDDLLDFPILFPINTQLATSSRISSQYGQRIHPISGKPKAHRGIDIAAPRGTPVYCAGNGRIARAGYDKGYGWFVEIEHAAGFSSLYGHLERLWVSVGDIVVIGEHIATVGQSGVATGNHLHFEIRKNKSYWDPAQWFDCLLDESFGR